MNARASSSSNSPTPPPPLRRCERIAYIGGGISTLMFIASVVVGSASQGTWLADVAAFGVLISLIATLVFVAIGSWHRDDLRTVNREWRRLGREATRPVDVPEAEGLFVVRGAHAKAHARHKLRLVRLALPLLLLAVIIALEWWHRLDT